MKLTKIQKENIKEIQKLKSFIQLKEIDNQLIFFISINNKKLNPICFSTSQDGYTGNIIRISPILNITYEDFDKLNKKNLHLYINSTYKKISEDFSKNVKNKTPELSILKQNEKVLETFKKEINSLNLKNIYGENKIDIYDIIETLNLTKGKIKNNRSKNNPKLPIIDFS